MPAASPFVVLPQQPRQQSRLAVVCKPDIGPPTRSRALAAVRSFLPSMKMADQELKERVEVTDEEDCAETRSCARSNVRRTNSPDGCVQYRCEYVLFE